MSPMSLYIYTYHAQRLIIVQIGQMRIISICQKVIAKTILLIYNIKKKKSCVWFQYFTKLLLIFTFFFKRNKFINDIHIRVYVHTKLYNTYQIIYNIRITD